jgi:hypothetical protein
VSHFKAGISLVALSVWLVACADLCENRVLSELTAPSGNTRAVVFERSCGATTGFSTHVSVLTASNALPKSAGNIFVADSDHGAANDMTVTVRWAARDQLVIRYPARARVFTKETQANGVAVTYETAP